MQVLSIFRYVYFHMKPQSCYRAGSWNENSVFALTFGNLEQEKRKVSVFL